MQRKSETLCIAALFAFKTKKQGMQARRFSVNKGSTLDSRHKSQQKIGRKTKIEIGEYTVILPFIRDRSYCKELQRLKEARINVGIYHMDLLFQLCVRFM